jgi:hypothetical protein
MLWCPTLSLFRRHTRPLLMFWKTKSSVDELLPIPSNVAGIRPVMPPHGTMEPLISLLVGGSSTEINDGEHNGFWKRITPLAHRHPAADHHSVGSFHASLNSITRVRHAWSVGLLPCKTRRGNRMAPPVDRAAGRRASASRAALTAPRPIKPTSPRCHSAWQRNPGRGCNKLCQTEQKVRLT